MEQPSPHILLAAMGEGKTVLGSLVSATKWFSLEATHITSAPSSLVRITT